MGKAVAPMMFRAIMALILGILVLVILIRGVSEAVYGACWDSAKAGFVNLKDGNNQIALGDCIDKVYILRNDQLDPIFKSEKVDIFKCSHKDDQGYPSFAIIKPNTNVGIVDVVTNPVGAIQRKLPDNFCVEYKFRLNSITANKNVLKGKKSYCINMQNAGNDPNVKNLNIREGDCGTLGTGSSGGGGASGSY